MAKFRESTFVNDFVMFRNACEERKLKYTLSRIDLMKTNYNKQQDKERLFFAIQHLSVPVHRKYVAPSNNNNKPSSAGDLAETEASSSSPIMQQKIQKNNALDERGEEIHGRKKDKTEKPLLKRLSSPSSVSLVQTDVVDSTEDCFDIKNGRLTGGKNTSSSSLKYFLTVEPQVNTRSSRKNSTNSEKSTTSFICTSISSVGPTRSSRSLTEEKLKNVNKDLLSELKNRKKINKEEKSQETSTLGLTQLPSKKVWEKQLVALKPADTVISRREQQEVAQRARDHWRASFNNMKTRRLSSYQSRVFSSTEDRDKTFVKFLSKRQQAFYMKDVQFVQKFLQC